ncbi:MAG: hypothetical protein HOP10_11180 [Chitinophagaceae bacterium]|nr:hypothetical protein [Chitinophagaceae bacterium]
MTNQVSVVKPDVLKENMLSISSFLKESYSSARKNIYEGVNFFKDEFSAFYNKTGSYINQMMLPVNNFLKDIAQINTELQQEGSKNYPVPGQAPLVPIDEALQSPMEENY